MNNYMQNAMNNYMQNDSTAADLPDCSASCRACLSPIDPLAQSTRVILTTLGARRYYHARCLQRVAHLPGPFPLEAA